MLCHRRGVIGYFRDGDEGRVAADSEAAKQPVCVPPGMSHAFWNAAADTDLHVDVGIVAAMPPDCHMFLQICTVVTAVVMNEGCLLPSQLGD